MRRTKPEGSSATRNSFTVKYFNDIQGLTFNFNSISYLYDMKNIRTLAILLLDDEHGINEAAFQELQASLTLEPGNEDILNAVKAQDGRYYLGEDDAQDLLAVE